PAGGDFGEFFDPAAAACLSTETPFLQADDPAIQNRRAICGGPEAVDQALKKPVDVVLDDVPPQVDEMTGNVYFDGTGVVASAAQTGGAGQIGVVAQAFE